MSGPSTIARLPEDVREKLHEWLRDPGITQREATDRANEVLALVGEPPISKSAVNRYDLRMREAGRKLQESRQVADAMVGKLGAAPQGQLGNLVNELLRTVIFELTLKIGDREITEETMPELTKLLRSLSLSAARLERAASENVKREKEIRKQAAEEITAAAEREARKGGIGVVTPERLREIAREVYGA